MTSELPQDYKEMLLQMVEDLGGTIEFTSTTSSTGRSSNMIPVSYTHLTLPTKRIV